MTNSCYKFVSLNFDLRSNKNTQVREKNKFIIYVIIQHV